MTDAKAYLMQVELYDTHINNKLEELARLKELLRHITSSIKDVPVHGGGNQDKLGSAVSKIVDLENEINEKIDDLIWLKERLMNCINRLSKPEYITVLERRYFKYVQRR